MYELRYTNKLASFNTREISCHVCVSVTQPQCVFEGSPTVTGMFQAYVYLTSKNEGDLTIDVSLACGHSQFPWRPVEFCIAVFKVGEDMTKIQVLEKQEM